MPNRMIKQWQKYGRNSVNVFGFAGRKYFRYIRPIIPSEGFPFAADKEGKGWKMEEREGRRAEEDGRKGVAGREQPFNLRSTDRLRRQ